jgi:glycopeptide antibiotics resistance protein
MILEFFPIPLLAGLLILFLLLLILRRRGCSLSYLFFFSLFWLYLLAVIAATLFPMPLPDSAGQIQNGSSAAYILSQVNLVPFDYSHFINSSRRYVLFREIIANVILTMPFGFGVSFITRIRRKTIPWLALAVGVGIEAAQLIMGLILEHDYRGVDINDSIMNALGVLGGYALFILFSRWYIRRTARLKIEPKGLAAYVYTIVSFYSPPF